MYMLHSYTLGARGDVTVGLGLEALVCVADRDAATGNIIPGCFSQRILLDAAALMPGGAEAANACAASLIATEGYAQNTDARLLLRAYPSCVFTGKSLPDASSQLLRRTASTSAPAPLTTTVRITFPAAAIAGCALRCRANGRTLPISIISTHSDPTGMLPASSREMETVTFVVHIAAAGIDGVAVLELVRGGGKELPSGDDRFTHHLSGVPVGVPPTPVLLVSDPEVHAALEEILALEQREQITLGCHHSTLYAVGATLLRGKAPPQQAFQLVCWMASKGPIGQLLTHRLLDIYPAASIITSATHAGTFLLHAVASGDLETVLTALYQCQEAAEERDFDTNMLAISPMGVDGETPLHRAAALHDRGGNADVMYELLATLAAPLAWSMGSPERPNLLNSSLVVDAVRAASATLVRVLRRYSKNTIEAATPGSPAAAEIIQEAISACPFPVGASSYENACSVIALEILSVPSSATRLLNVAVRFSSGNAITASAVTGVAASSPVHNHDDPLVSSPLLSSEISLGAFIAAACKRWPALGRSRTRSARVLELIDSVREGAVGGMRRFRRMTLWVGKYGPNGDGSLIFDHDPKLERLWMDSQARTHSATDYTVFTLFLISQFACLFRFHRSPMLRSTDEETEVASVLEIVPQPAIPCLCAAFLILFKMRPLWYRRHRETIIIAFRFIATCIVIRAGWLFQYQDASSLFRRNILLVSNNLAPVFYPIRADRHFYIQLLNTVITFLLCRGTTSSSADNWPLRSFLAGVGFVISLLLEMQSRRAFALEQEQARLASTRRLATQQGKGAQGRGDWFKWGASSSYCSKSSTKGTNSHTESTTKKA